jgi:murein DD-endopeptidase MepM/ murein hydrolase activator NlpD
MYTKQLLYFVTLLVFIVSCTLSRVPDLGYGGRASYGIHVGLDYKLSIGTPIIACADGEVLAIYETGKKTNYSGGITIRILHISDNEDVRSIISIYAHLLKPMVSLFERVKRGQLIGLSGKSNNGHEHLHFAILKPGTLDESRLRNTYNPLRFAIGGYLQCFDPKRDYSIYSEADITLPIPCGDYKKELISKIKSQKN